MYLNDRNVKKRASVAIEGNGIPFFFNLNIDYSALVGYARTHSYPLAHSSISSVPGNIHDQL